MYKKPKKQKKAVNMSQEKVVYWPYGEFFGTRTVMFAKINATLAQ